MKEEGLGKKTINYKLRDWLFSRQRYWGEPFPIVWKRRTALRLCRNRRLPLLPPKLDDYKPTPDGQPPLARAKDWVNLPDGSVRETNTMPQWAGSCWYYLRYLDAQNENAFCWQGSGKILDGKAESVESPTSNAQQSKVRRRNRRRELICTSAARSTRCCICFTRGSGTRCLFDLGYVSTPEPFFKLVNQGLILGEDGQKMSKSRGNVVNPDDVLSEYGADAFRLYEMFMGPLEMVKPWNTKGVEGVYRFLGKVWRLFVDEQSETEFEQNLTAQPAAGAEHLAKLKLSAAIQDVEANPGATQDTPRVHQESDGRSGRVAFQHGDFRADGVRQRSDEMGSETARGIAGVFDLAATVRAAPRGRVVCKTGCGGRQSSGRRWLIEPWPKFDAALLVESTLEIPVQVNGKLRDVIKVAAEASQEELQALALASREGKTLY